MRSRQWVLLCLVMGFVFLAGGRNVAQETPFENGRFWKSEDLFLHYQMWCPSMPREKVLFIHGLGGSTFSWRHAPDFFLPAGYVVVAVDLPGFGYSERVVGAVHKPESRVQLLLEFLQYLDENVLPREIANHRWCLVGHSMGGTTAFLMALQEPQRFRGAVLIDAALQGPPVRFFKIFTSFPLTRSCFVALIRNFFLSPSRLRRSLRAAYGRKVTDEEFQGYYRPLKLPGTARSLLSFVNNASSFTLSSFRDKPHPPFLLIWGEKDRFVPVKQGKKFQNVFPGTPLYRVQGAAHSPMETHPQEVYPVIVDFLSAREK